MIIPQVSEGAPHLAKPHSDMLNLALTLDCCANTPLVLQHSMWYQQ